MLIFPNKHTCIFHLPLPQGLHCLLNPSSRQRKGQDSRKDILCSHEFKKGTDAIARGNQGTLYTDASEAQLQRGYRGVLKRNSQGIDRTRRIRYP